MTDRPVRPLPTIRFGEEIISDFARKRRAEGRLWAEGYTQSELDFAQERYDLAFPPDLIALLLEKRPVPAYDWRIDEAAIREMLARPLEGILFDVEHANLWWPEWGERPMKVSERAEVVGSIVGSAPKLIPLVSHRYLPTEPNEAGNPIFSIVQSDIIYYGANLTDYFDREFGSVRQPISSDIKSIRFWSKFAEG